MTRTRLARAAAACVLIASAGATAAGPTTQAAPFAGPRLQVPPRQAAAWEPPTTALPAALVDATRRLFDHGMADPRGGEYRAVEVAVGNCWTGGGHAVATHAWVLPAAAGEATRFAVGWNGLVYPCVSVGDAANLAADVAALSKDRGEGKGIFERGSHAFREDHAVSEQSRLPLKACLLLRLGEGKLAEDYWSAAWPVAAGADGRPNVVDPYLRLAQDWAWAAFDRAVCAHMRGDDVVSRDTAEVLAAAWPKIEAAAAEKGFERPTALNPRNLNQELPNPPYVPFLPQLPALLDDARRRVKDGPVARVLDRPELYAGKAERVAGLIRDLETNSARQWGQPGGVSLADDPVVRALEKEGEDAVEPLLKCMEDDRRLTRAVSFGRDFFRGRNLLTVSDAAFVTLTHVLQMSDFGAPRDDERDPQARAAAARAYWEKHKGQTAERRWYETLRDDNATPDQWREAAARITRPVDVEVRGGWVTVPDREPGAVPAMRGESLRSLRDPSVAELIERRIPAIAAERDGWLFAVNHATEMALALAKWDADAAGPALAAQLARSVAAYDKGLASPHDGTQTSRLMTRGIGRLTVALARRPDSGPSLALYAEWLKRLTPEAAEDNAIEAFRPLWRTPDAPGLAAAGERVFNDPASPWSCLPKTGRLRRSGFTEFTETPLICTPAFRKHLARNLADTTEAGTVKVTDQDRVTVTPATGESDGYRREVIDPALTALRGQSWPLRVGDWYAWKLSHLGGAPAFELFWPQERRDAGRREMTAFVERWGPHFRPSTEFRAPAGRFPDEEKALLAFPRRDRPATDADVAAGTAIFALKGEKVRAVPLDAWPTAATWTTLKDFPHRVQYFDPKAGTSGTRTDYLNEGLIWQAEEVLEGGRWQRYYGFVGPHGIARVPAEQIEIGK